MTAPLSSFSGLISGFNYKDLVDQIIAVEGRPAARLRSESAAAASRLTAIGTYRGLLDKLRSAAQVFRTGLALDATSATMIVEAGTKALATVTTAAGLSPASFTLEVSQLARAQKLGSAAQADAAAPLGLSGTFTLNGASVVVTADDSLIAIRDAVNALNTGATPTKVSASILTVAPGQQRLVLTSTVTGETGIALADTVGTALQSLGLLDGGGVVPPSAVLVAGRDAHFTIDGVDFERSSNVVSDAIEGVTLTLTGDEPGARTAIRVDRYGDSARTAIQSFVDAYNALVTFLKQQGTASETSRPVLYGESILRSARSALPARLLEQVLGAAPDLATASAAGISFKRDGTLTLDAAKFDDAFANRFADLRALFTETRSATAPDVTLVTGGGNVTSGTYAVDITAPATRAQIESLGFGGAYDAGATPDELSITDNLIGRAVTVTLTTGMTTGDIVTALQDAIDAGGLGIAVEVSGSEVRLTHQSYGSRAGISVLNAGAGDGAQELWAAGATTYGTDVAGTIGGNAATGTGQVLVGNAGTPSAGLAVSYAGTVAGAAGTVTLALGVGASIERILDGFLQTGSGSLAQRESSLTRQTGALDARATTLETRLESRRAALMLRFTMMEAAIARLQQQSSALLGLSKSPSVSG
ncbi:MAG: flagellar filament capping protein FliD [Gemmatimonadales bacterium]|nr:flagellar filament capping protein FliD [Gemmatimonadales bacterium]